MESFRAENEAKLEDNSEISSDGRKRSFSAVSDEDEHPTKRPANVEEKKWKRVMANRRSAKESRERRKKLLSDLEVSVDILSKENQTLQAENTELRQQLAILLPQARANMSLLSGCPAPGAQRSSLSSLLAGGSLRPGNILNNVNFAKERQLFEASLLNQIQF